MNHMELSAAVHELGTQYGSRDTHTSECISVGRRGRETPYYYAQVWFSHELKDCVGVMGSSPEEALSALRAGLEERIGVGSATPMHPMARHAAMLMAAEAQS